MTVAGETVIADAARSVAAEITDDAGDREFVTGWVSQAIHEALSSLAIYRAGVVTGRTPSGEDGGGRDS